MSLEVAFDGVVVTNCETGDDANWASQGGGPGSAQEVDTFVQGAESRGRRVTGAKAGFSYQASAGVDLTGAGAHVGMWGKINTWSLVSVVGSGGFSFRLGGGTDPDTSPFSEWWIYGTDNLPASIGWFRTWLDVDRGSPDLASGTFSAGDVESFGASFNVNSPQVGNARNCFLDAIHYITSGGGLTGSSSGGTFQDFLDFDAGTPGNLFGVVEEREGAFIVNARLTIGTSATAAGSETVFADASQVLIFADQQFAESTFLGLTCMLQHNSSSIIITDTVFRSGGSVNLGDFVGVGSLGALSMTRMSFNNMRTIDLTLATSLTETTIIACDKMNQLGATLAALLVSGATTADAEAFLISDDPAKIRESEFIFSDGHAIELTAATSGGTFGMAGNLFTSFGGSGTNDAAIFNDSGGAVVLNITDGGDTPTIRNGSGASTTVNNNITATVTVLDKAGDPIVGATVSVRLVSDNSEVLSGTTNGSGVVTGSVAASLGAVSVRVRKGSGGGTDYVPVNSPQTIGALNFSTTITMDEDVNNAT